MSTEADTTAPEQTEGQASGSPSQDVTPSGEQVKELRQRLTEMGEQNKTAKVMVSYLKENHPDVFQATYAHLTGQTSPKNFDKEMNEILDTFEDPKAKDALSRFAQVIESKVRSELAPQLQAVQSVAQSAAEERGLRAAGVDLYDAEFTKARPALEDRRYQALLRAEPELAAEYLGERYLASTSANGSRASTKEAAAATTSTGTRSSGEADTFEVKGDTNILDIYKQIQGGKKPK